MHEKRPEMTADFHGTKVALINKGRVLVIQRDNNPDIPFAGLWDLPGGGSDGQESYLETAQREIKEKLNIELAPEDVVWLRPFPALSEPTKDSMFLVANVSDEQLQNLRLGDEGGALKMMPVSTFLNLKNSAVPGMQHHLRQYFNSE